MASYHIKARVKAGLAAVSAGLNSVLRLTILKGGGSFFAPFLAALPAALRRRISLPLSLPVRRLGVNMKIPLGGSGVSLDDTLHYLERWDGSWKAEVFKTLIPGVRPTFVDIGANIGQTLLEIFATHPGVRYIGFEPIPACADYLARMIRANDWATATVIASALAADGGVIRLYRHSGFVTDCCATVYQDRLPGRTFEMNWVPSLPFDAVKEKMQLDDIDFIKIDVEGAELDVIKGMEQTLNSVRPIVLCEVLFTDRAADIALSARKNEELFRLLALHAYTIWQVIKSEDLVDVKGARRIAAFPQEYYNESNAQMCDYLFIPKERARQLPWVR